MKTNGVIHENLYTENQVAISLINGATGTDWDTAGLKISSKYNLNNFSRAGISLENNGMNACLIFLDIDGSLKVVFNNGVKKTISLI